MPIEASAHLGCDIRQYECLIHGLLGYLGVRSWNPSSSSTSDHEKSSKYEHMSTIIPTPEVILQFCAEHRREGFILNERRV